MVNMTPDPPQEEPAVASNENLLIGGGNDSDEDDDDGIYDGYEMLPTEVEEANQISEEEGSLEMPEPAEHSRSNFDEAVAEELKEVWTKPIVSKEEMDPQLRDEVLRAMKGFSLPSSAIPQWANDVTEEEWKKHLLDKIQGEQQS